MPFRSGLLISLAVLTSVAPAAFAGYSFSTIDPQVPGLNFAQATGINDSGDVVGIIFDSVIRTPSQRITVYSGFLERNGSFTFLDDPLADRHTMVPGMNSAGLGTFVVGIDSVGRVAGNYFVGYCPFFCASQEFGFVEENGVYTTVNIPSAPGPNLVLAVSPGGKLLVQDNSGQVYLDDAGVFTPVALPEQFLASGINDRSDIVGSIPGSGDVPGAGYFLRDGVLTEITDPDAPGPEFPGAINNAGQIVGTGVQGGFLLSGGTFTAINDPRSLVPPQEQYLTGINDSAQIVGYTARYLGAGPTPYRYSAFLATPDASPVPEPSTSGLLLLVAVLAAGLLQRSHSIGTFRRRAASASSFSFWRR